MRGHVFATAMKNRNWSVLLGACFTFLMNSCAPAAVDEPAASQPSDPGLKAAQALAGDTVVSDPLYVDAIHSGWLPSTWSCSGGSTTYDVAQTDPVYSGATSLRVTMHCPQGYGAFMFDRRNSNWTSTTYMYPNQYTHLSFAFNPGTNVAAAQNLRITLDNDSSGRNLVDYTGALAANQWYDVHIPLAHLNSLQNRFMRVAFFNNGVLAPDYTLDNVVLSWTSDTAAPQISNVNVTGILQDRASISWSTNEYAQYELTYVAADDPLAEPITLTGTAFTKGQSVDLTDLAPSTTYHFLLVAMDHQIDPNTPSNESVYEGTLTTSAPDVTAPELLNVTVTQVSSSAVTVCWETSEPANARLLCQSAEGQTREVSATAMATSHCETVGGLLPSAAYTCSVTSADTYGNLGTSAAQPLTTLAPTQATLQAFPGEVVQPFSRHILGVNIGNWNVYWNNPYPNESPKLRELTKLIKPGIIRYAGGLASDVVKWDRNNEQCHPTQWVKSPTGQSVMCYRHLLGNENGVDMCGLEPQVSPMAYQYAYQADEIDSLAAFAHYVGSDVMMEVNMVTCDPSQWADMLHYTNVEHDYGFKYWELGNELDLVQIYGVGKIVGGDPRIPTGAEYVRRFKLYSEALRAVDSTIEIVAPGSASHDPTGSFRAYSDFIMPLMTDAKVQTEQMLNVLSVHYYPWWNRSSYTVTMQDIFSFAPATSGSRRSHVTACMAEKRAMLAQHNMPHTRIAITEFNSMAADTLNPLVYNHAGALYLSDMLGRLAYSGADMVMNWELFDTPRTNSYGLIDINKSTISYDSVRNRTTLNDRYVPMPVYYAHLLYAQFFGDAMVRSQSSAENVLSIWASTDSQEPGYLKLVLVNLGEEYYQAEIALNGTMVTQGRAYLMANEAFNTATDKASVTDGTRINGLQIDASSAAQIAASFQTIAGSGTPVVIPGGHSDHFVHNVPPFSVTSIVLSLAP